MPSTAGQGSAVALLSALPAAPSAEQLLAARSAAEFALQPVLQEQQAGDESQQQHASPEVAKQHGPQVLQLMQVLGTKLGSASDKGASRVLAELACSALHALDRLRKHMKAKGLELEAQRYNFVRRITMAGQFDLALQQGWCLRDALAAQVQAAATSPLPKELTDMQLACSLNLVVCTCELLDSGKSKGADNHISRVLPIFTDLVDVLRHAGTPEAKKHAEGLVRRIYKLLQVALGPEVALAQPGLAAETLAVFMQVVDLNSQLSKLPQYIAKLAAELAEAARVGLVEALLGISSGQVDDATQQQSLEACMKGAGHSTLVAAAKLHGWTAAAEDAPHLGLAQAALAVKAVTKGEAACMVNTDLLQRAVDALLHGDTQAHAMQLAAQSLQGALDTAVCSSMPEECSGFLQALEPAASAALAQFMQLQVAQARQELEGGCAAGETDAISTAVLAIRLAASACVKSASSSREQQQCQAVLNALYGDVLAMLKTGALDQQHEDLQWATAQAAIAGSEVGKVGLAHAAAMLLHMSAECSLHTLTAGPESQEALAQVERRCRSHVSALEKMGEHEQAAAAAAHYVLVLQEAVGMHVELLASLIKLHARARLQALVALGSEACESEVASTSMAPVAAAKSKATSKGRGKATAQQAEPKASCSQPCLPNLTEQLAAAYAEGRVSGESAQHLDLYAYEEVACAQEACSSLRAAASGELQQEVPEDSTAGRLAAALTSDINSIIGCLQSASTGDAERHASAVLLAALLQPEQEAGAAALAHAADVLVAKAEGLMEAEDEQGPCISLQEAARVSSRAALAATLCALAAAREAATAATAGHSVDGSSEQDSARNHHEAASSSGQSSHEVAAESHEPSIARCGQAWIKYQEHASRAHRMWGQLSSTLAAAGGQPKVAVVQPATCLSLLTQLLQLAQLHDDTSGMQQCRAALLAICEACKPKVPRSLAQAWALSMPCTGLAAWALEPQLMASLVELAGAQDRLAPELLHILKQLEAARLLAEDGSDSAQVCASLDECAAQAASSSSSAAADRAHLWLLQRAQLHHLAAGAHLRRGHTSDACAHAQEGLTLAGAVYAALSEGASGSSSNSTTDGPGPGQAAGASQRSSSCSLVLWQASYQYLGSQLLAAEAFELAGCVEEATCLLKECRQLAASLHCCAAVVQASARLAAIARKQGSAEKAAALLLRAQAELEQGKEQLQRNGQVAAYVRASVHLEAGLACASGATQDAGTCEEQQQRLRQALGAVGEAVQQEGVQGLPWRRQASACELWLVYAQLSSQPEDAQYALAQAAAAIGCAPGGMASDPGASCCCWPLQQAALLLEHGRAMLRQQGSLSDAKQLMSGGPAVAGLQATQSSSGGSSHDAAAVRELEARLAQVSLQPKETKARSASAASSASSAAAAKTKTKVTGTKASAKAAGGAQDAAGAPSPLASLLHALQLCWSSPLLAAQVCSELVHAAWAQGMVHTAAMFLHLSIGLPQQQQLCIAAKEQAVPWSQSVATSTSSSAAGEEDCAKQDRDQQRSAPPSQRQGLASRLQDLLSSAHKLVAQALAGNDGSKAGGVDAQSLDSKAAAWLDSLLAQLPGDSAVAGITCLPGPAGGSAQAGGGLVLSRLARGSVPVLMLLPEPPQEKTPSWSREQDCSKEQQQQGMGTGKGPASTLVSMLANLLERSSQSMKTAELQTAAQKAQWWKSRVELDQHMRELLVHMESHWLGPWRVLLLPLLPSLGQALQQPAAAAVQQHFPAPKQAGSITGGASVVQELVLLLMARLHELRQEEQAAAVVQLGKAAQQPWCEDESSVQHVVASLLASASAAHAAVKPVSCSSSSSCCCCSALQGSSKQQQPASCAVQALKAAAADKAPTAPESVEVTRRMAPAPSSRLAASKQAASSASASAATAAAATTAAVAAEKAGASGRVRSSRLASLQDAPAAEAAGSKAPTRGSRSRSKAEAAPAPAEAAPAAPAVLKGSSRARAGTAKAKVAVEAAAEPAEAAGPDADEGGRDTDCVTDQPVDAPSMPEAQGSQAAESNGTQGVEHATGTAAGGPVLLVLQPELHAMPWESMPCMQQSGTQAYRVLSLPIAAAAAAAAVPGAQGGVQRGSSNSQPGGSKPASAVAAASAGLGGKVPRALSRSTSSSSSSRQSSKVAAGSAPAKATGASKDGDSAAATAAGAAAAARVPTNPALDLRSTFFLLNPGGDLQETQQCFEAWFTQELGWKGMSGAPPSSDDLISALQSHPFFMYFGHGSGEQYLPLPSVRRLSQCAANVLMGCSSGRLRQYGQYGVSGAVVAYLMAGCPALVANLWDVTDRDIDRFSQALIRHWLGQPPEQDKAPAQGQQQQGQKAGQQAKMRSKTSSSAAAEGASAASQAASGSSEAAGAVNSGGSSSVSGMCGAVCASRAVCKLPHLIGAAPVCYGLPVQVVWGAAEQ